MTIFTPIAVSTALMFGVCHPSLPAFASAPGTRSLLSSDHSRTNLAATTTSVNVYLIGLGDAGKSGKRIGCGDSVIAVARTTAPTKAPLKVALNLLLGDRQKYYGQSGLYNALYQSRLTIQRASVRHGKASVFLVGRIRLNGECDDPRVGAQLRQTCRQFPSVHSVAIYINGVPLRRVLSGKGFKR